jgi:NAD(P)-dependent dehydrogenase (short-subunit alcohol dehydrogenase family)
MHTTFKDGVVALSKGLRRELAPRGIGISALCPGFIRTQIMNSSRNLPKRFEGGGPCLADFGPICRAHLLDLSFCNPRTIVWTCFHRSVTPRYTVSRKWAR